MGCFGFLKVIMFIFNGVIFLAGAAILAVGIWVKVDSGSILSFIGKIDGAPAGVTQILNVGYLLIAVGAVLLVIGFLGCWGAAKESRCMLLLFFTIVLLVFIAEVAGAIVILVFKPFVEDLIGKLKTTAVQSIKAEYGKNDDVTGLWDTTMKTLTCCGFNNYTDFTDSPYYKNTNNEYPLQCCSDSANSCNSTMAEKTGGPGCFSKVEKLINDNIVIIAAVALGIAALEIAAMVVAMILYCQIGSKMA